MTNRKIANEVLALTKSLGWQITRIETAYHGSIYIDIVKDSEWLIIRVADHKKYYESWLKTISIAPGDYWFEDLEELLTQPRGTIGDIL